MNTPTPSIVLRSLLPAVAIAVLLAACGSQSNSSAGAPAPATSPAVPAPTATPARVSLEGRFSYDQMQGFLDTVTPMVAQFFDAEYPNLPHPRGVVFVPHGRAGASPCGYDSGDSYEYCPGNQSIYIGQDLLWAFYRMGDAGPVVGLAHEWGHHIQTMRRLPFPRTASQSVAFENQADCVAGAWTQYADNQGWLELPDDLNDVNGLLRAIGSRETAGRDHGTAAERENAFNLGMKSGIKACNAFEPGAPIA